MSSLKALHIHISSKKGKAYKQMHACTYECMTHLAYLTTTQHLWHYA